MKPLRYAMVGGGLGSSIGKTHRRACALDETARLVAGAFSSTPERSIESGAALGLDPGRVYGTWHELVESESARSEGDRIDFVSVVTPNDGHYRVSKACLEAGLHVVCDKPFTITSAQGAELRDIAKSRGLVCAVTYNYSGSPMVREMAQLIGGGAIGPVRRVQAEYLQDWLARPIELDGQKQAAWRVDPARAGLGGALGDIGTHAEHLIRFVTGLGIDSLCAELSTFVPDRRLDDDGSVLLRFRGGARGALTFSQVCVGERNGLTLRVYGESGGLVWQQENPEELVHHTHDQTRVLYRGSPGLSARAAAGTRVPPGHPEGYLEAFANIYRGAAELIRASRDGTEPGPLGRDTPSAEDGRLGVRFVEACVESAGDGSGWVSMG